MQPAFFGEVVLPSSRAVDVDFGDDFDEEVPPKNKIVVDMKKDLSTVVGSLKYLIIASGFHPSNFAKVYLISDDSKSEIIFSIKIFSSFESVDEGDNRSLPISTLDFYHCAKTKSLIALTTSKYAPTADVANEVIRKIFEQLTTINQTWRIFIFDFKPSAFYQSINRASIENKLSTTGVVRVLMSSQEKTMNKDDLRQLEMPNMVDGLAASALTYCELKGLRATLYVLYGSDASDAIGTNVATYHDALERVGIWKSEFLTHGHGFSGEIHKNKIAQIVQQSVPIGSMFG